MVLIAAPGEWLRRFRKHNPQLMHDPEGGYPSTDGTTFTRFRGIAEAVRLRRMTKPTVHLEP